MDRIVNVGVIGCGGIANGKHMPALQKIKNVRMVAFCDIIEERAVEAAEKFGVFFIVQTGFYDVVAFRCVVSFGHSVPPSFLKK